MDKVNMDLTKEDIAIIWEAISSCAWSGKLVEQVSLTKAKFLPIVKELERAMKEAANESKPK